MKKQIYNPWTWQDSRSYVQAVEIKNHSSILYISGQTAINENGISSNENMRNQMIQTLQNLEKVILEANYELKDIFKLNIYTTSNDELLQNFDVFQNCINQYEIKQTVTVIEVKSLFESLKIEIEATLAK